MKHPFSRFFGFGEKEKEAIEVEEVEQPVSILKS